MPQDFAYADILLPATDPAWAGGWVHQERLGEIAVEQLVHRLESNALGAPATATTTLIGGSWQEGESLPPRQTKVRQQAGTALFRG